MDEAQIVPEVAEAPVAEVTTTPDVTPQPEAQAAEAPFFSEDELKALLDFKEPEVTSPQLFNPEGDDKAKADPTAILTESLDQMIEELEKTDAEVSNFKAKAEEAEQKITEYQEQVTAIEELFSKVQSVIWEDTAKALALGDMDNVPLHLIPENWSRVEKHPVLWPLVIPLLKGEEVDIPGFLKKLAESRKASMPNIQTTTPAAPVKTEVVNPLKSIISGIRSI